MRRSWSWPKKQKQNTEQAYLAFIEKYQDQSATEQIKEARKAIILIKFTEAQKNTLEGYDLVDLYNKDPLAEQQLLQANQLSETLIFEQCRINMIRKIFENTLQDLRKSTVPENMVTVRNWLWFHDINQAKKQDSLITYSTFLSNYLNDKNAKDDIKWVRKSTGTSICKCPKKRFEVFIRILFSNIAMTVKPQKWFHLQIGNHSIGLWKGRIWFNPKVLRTFCQKIQEEFWCKKICFKHRSRTARSGF